MVTVGIITYVFEFTLIVINIAFLAVVGVLLTKAGCDEGRCSNRRLLDLGPDVTFDVLNLAPPVWDPASAAARALQTETDPKKVEECTEFLTADQVQASTVKAQTAYVPAAIGSSITMNILMMVGLTMICCCCDSNRNNPQSCWWRYLHVVSLIAGLVLIYPIVVMTQLATTFAKLDICFEKIGSQSLVEEGTEEQPANDFVPYVDTFSRTINAITVILYLTMFFRLLLAGLLFCVDSGAAGGGGGGGTGYAQHHDEHHAIEMPVGNGAPATETTAGKFAGVEAGNRSESVGEHSMVVQQPAALAAKKADDSANVEFSRPHAGDYRGDDFDKLSAQQKNRTKKKKKKPRQEFQTRPTTGSVYNLDNVGQAPKI